MMILLISILAKPLDGADGLVDLAFHAGARTSSRLSDRLRKRATRPGRGDHRLAGRHAGSVIHFLHAAEEGLIAG